MDRIHSGNDGKALKSAVWYVISSFLIRSIGLITTPVFTRLLTQDDYGQFSNYTSWLSILTIVITLNLESTLMSAKYDYEKTLDRYFLSMICLSSLSVTAWAAMLNIFYDAGGQLFGLKKIYLNVMLLYLFFLPAITMFQTRERFFYFYKKNVLLSVLISLSTAFLSVFLVMNMQDRLTARILGSAVPSIVIGIVLYLYFICKVKQIDFSCWKYALKICMPYIPHSLSLMLLNSMDRVMVNRIRGGRENALYSLAYSCALLITMLFSALNNAYAPWLGEKLSQNETGKIRDFSKKYVAFFFLFAAEFILAAPELVYIMGGTEYMEAVYVIPPVGMALAAQFTYALFVNIEQYKKKTMGMAAASVSAAFLNYILNSLFIPKYGYFAAACTTLAGYLYILFVHMWIVKKLEYDSVYDYRFIFLCICAMGVFSMLSCILYMHTAVRWTVMIFGFLCFVYYLIRNYENMILVIKKR